MFNVPALAQEQDKTTAEPVATVESAEAPAPANTAEGDAPSVEPAAGPAGAIEPEPLEGDPIDQADAESQDEASGTEVEPPTQDEASGTEVEPPTPDELLPPEQKGFGIGNKYARFMGRLQTIFLWRSDSDFDQTPPLYNANGQDVGVVGTFLAPMLVVTPVKELKMVFELEMGLNIWSTHDPDNYSTSLPDWFRVGFRQAYVEGNFEKQKIGFRVGYEKLFDPTGLFVGHWLGAANFWTRQKWGQVTFTVAQMPDQTYEGIAFDSNNFNSDTILYGARLTMPFNRLKLDAAIWGIHDSQVVGRTMDLMAITANLSGDWRWIKFGLDLGLQYGTTEGRAGGDNETTLAWALQAYMNMDRRLQGVKDLNFLLDLNVLAISADDDWDGNTRNGAWLYSGKSRSRTLILTEDELRDRGGNIDELVSDRRNADKGKFWLNRAGLTVADVSFGLLHKNFFKPMVTIGAGWALNDRNALGASFVGLEADLHLEFLYKKYLSVDIAGTTFLPGKAAAAFVNKGPFPGAVDPVYQLEASVMFFF